MFEIQSPQKIQGERTVSTLGKMQVPNGMVPGVRRNKRRLFASCTRCKLSMKTSWNLVIRSKSVIRSSLVLTSSRFSEMSDQRRVSLYMVMSQNAM